MSACGCRVKPVVVEYECVTLEYTSTEPNPEILYCPRHAEAHVVELEARLTRMREALRTYGQHINGCTCSQWNLICPCGLTTALRGEE